MSIRIPVAVSALLVSFAVLGPACDAEETTDDSSIRHIHFDAADLNDVLSEDPETRFLVDLREGNVVHFDQQDENFDFSAFDAICPSMPAPVPFPELMESLDLEFEGEAAWTMQSDLTEDEQTDQFRCSSFELVCNNFGLDCVLIRTWC